MPDIEVRKINESTVFIACESPQILRDITSLFSIMIENARWNPKVKAKIWDGKIRFFDNNHQLPIGLVPKLENFAGEGNYTLTKNYDDIHELSKENFMLFVNSLQLQSNGIDIEPRDFQLKAAYEAITKTKLTIDSSTGSGKSLIIYIIVRYLYEVLHKKIFIVVPTVALVNQLIYDFMDYGWNTCEDKICTVYAGQNRIMSRPIIISTWQSLYIDNQEHLQMADVLILDEHHLAKGKSLQTLTRSCSNSVWRIGLSGSLPKPDTAAWHSVVGATGEIKTYSTYKKLQDAGQLSKLKINMIQLQYPESIRRENFTLNDSDYPKESDYVNAIPERNKFIRKLAEQLEGNTLIFFQKKEKHGYIIKTELEKCTTKKILYVDGDTNKDMDYIKHYVETHDNCVLLGSNVMVTGINIKRIHNVIFAFMGKSMVKVKQAIGRSLRLHESKDCAVLYDICDDLRIKVKIHDSFRNYSNYSWKHAKERIEIYKEMGFDVNMIEYKMKTN